MFHPKRNIFAAFLLFFAIKCVAALYKDQAGIFDWHKELVGTPKAVLLERPNGKSQLHVATHRNVITYLSPKTGAIGWRKQLEPSDEIHLLSNHVDNTLISISGTDGIRTRMWDALSGYLIWESEFVQKGRSDIMIAVAILGKDLVTVVGNEVTKFSGKDGSKQWNLIGEGDLLDITVSDGTIYAITVDDNSLVVAKIASDTGNVIEFFGLGKISGRNFIILKDRSKNSFIAWKNPEGIVLTHKFGNKWTEVSLFPLESYSKSGDAAENIVQIFSAQANVPQFVINTKLGNTVLIEVSEEEMKVVSIWSKSDGAEFVSGAILDDAAIVGQVIVNNHKVSGQLIDCKSGKLINSFTLPHEYSESGNVLKLVLDLYRRKDKTDVLTGFRFLAITEDGSIQMIRDSEKLWSREESLTHIVDSNFIDLPETRGFSEDRDELDEFSSETEKMNPVQRYLRRIKIHTYRLASLPSQLAFSSKKSLKTAVHTSPNITTDALTRDLFGIFKLIVFGTSTGKLVALDTLKGRIVWTRYLGSELKQLITVRSVFVRQPPLIVVVGNKEKNTLLWTINPLNGETVGEVGRIPADSAQVTKLNILDPVEHSNVLAVVDTSAKVWIYPATGENHAAFQSKANSFYFYLADGRNKLKGYTLRARSNSEMQHYDSISIWETVLSEGEEIAAFGTKNTEEQVPSIGRVLGNRQVLYKYLNPNVIAFGTVRQKLDPTPSTIFSIYLLDVVTGSILYNAEHAAGGYVEIGSKISDGIHIALSENWVVYSFYNHGPEFASKTEILTTTSSSEEEPTVTSEDDEIEREKERVRRRRMKKLKKDAAIQEEKKITEVRGEQVVVLELFENVKPDQRIESTTFSSFNSKKPYVMAQAYLFPRTISAIGVTDTRNGITVREVIFAVPKSIFGVSKRILDPRRPSGSLTADDKEEMLIPYKGAIEFSEKDVASHNREVLGVEKILSSPATLESTSLVVSYGLDIFFTRRMPSKTFDLLNEDFNYASLVGTMIALLIGIFVAQHFVAKQKLAEAWK